jgi:hypothetical protein
MPFRSTSKIDAIVLTAPSEPLLDPMTLAGEAAARPGKGQRVECKSSGDDVCWHFSDMLAATTNVRYWG